jgi:thiol-disulfide isomerase/thioredoxin
MRFLLAAILALTLAPIGVRAAGSEPQVYFFWAEGCGDCRAAREFLDRAKAEDPRIQVRDFDVEGDLSNAILFGELCARIGLAEFRLVPLVVVGTHVVIGYDESVAREILEHIDACRKNGCRDIVHDLIRVPSEVEQASAAAPR